MARRLARLKSRLGSWVERGVRVEGLHSLWKAFSDDWWPWLLGYLKWPGAFMTGGWTWVEWRSVPVALTLALAFYASARFASLTRAAKSTAASGLAPMPAPPPASLQPEGSEGLARRVASLEAAFEAARSDRERVHQETLTGFASVGERFRVADERLDNSAKATSCLSRKITGLSEADENLESRVTELERVVSSIREEGINITNLLLNRDRGAKLDQLKRYFARIEIKLSEIGRDDSSDSAIKKEVEDAAAYISTELVNLLGYGRDDLNAKYREIEDQIAYEIRNAKLDQSSQGWAYAERRFRLLGRLLDEQEGWIRHFDHRSTIWLYGTAKDEPQAGA
jgi:hypothetical protein